MSCKRSSQAEDSNVRQAYALTFRAGNCSAMKWQSISGTSKLRALLNDCQGSSISRRNRRSWMAGHSTAMQMMQRCLFACTELATVRLVPNVLLAAALQRIPSKCLYCGRGDMLRSNNSFPPASDAGKLSLVPFHNQQCCLSVNLVCVNVCQLHWRRRSWMTGHLAARQLMQRCFMARTMLEIVCFGFCVHCPVPFVIWSRVRSNE